jgi:hypothetical protein
MIICLMPWKFKCSFHGTEETFLFEVGDIQFLETLTRQYYQEWLKVAEVFWDVMPSGRYQGFRVAHFIHFSSVENSQDGGNMFARTFWDMTLCS